MLESGKFCKKVYCYLHGEFPVFIFLIFGVSGVFESKKNQGYVESMLYVWNDCNLILILTFCHI